MIFLYLTIYGKYFFGAVLLGLLWELFQTLRQARRERKEERQHIVKESTKVTKQPVVLLEDNTEIETVEVVREDVKELTAKEVAYEEEDEREADQRRERVKSTGPPRVA